MNDMKMVKFYLKQWRGYSELQYMYFLLNNPPSSDDFGRHCT